MNINFYSSQAIELESVEASCWSRLYHDGNTLASFSVKTAGAFAGAVPEADILALNRVVGLGMYRYVKGKDLENIIDFYRTTGSRRFFIQISPHVLQDDIRAILREKGFRHHNNWVKLLRTSSDKLPYLDSSLQIVEVGKEQADLYGQLLFMSFGWEDTRLAQWLSGAVGKPGFRHYLVMLNNKAIAAGALFVEEEYASMMIAGTLHDYRGLGAQKLLLMRRIQDAQRAGCRYIISETGEEKPDKPVASLRNMLWAGFERAYVRENWIFEF